MSIKVTPLGNGRYKILVSVHNPKNPKRNFQKLWTVGEGTKFPCSTKRDAEKRYGEPVENDFLSRRDGEDSALLNFGKLKQKYIFDKNPKDNIVRLLNGPLAELDSYIMQGFDQKVEEWIRIKEQEPIAREMRVNTCRNCGHEAKADTSHPERVRTCPQCQGQSWSTELRMENTGRRRSPETIRHYKRYISAVLINAGKRDALGSKFVIGKTQPREITIMPDFLIKLEETARNDKEFNWFWTHLDFAMKNPIRPADQFRTLRHPIPQVPEIVLSYKPQKTYNDTGRQAVPEVYPEHVHYFRRPPIESEWVFPNRDGSCLYPDDEHPYYNDLFKRICRRAGLQPVKWYELRHVAVAWCIAQGKTDSAIMKITGWSSREMLDHYHANNEILVVYFRSQFKKSEERKVDFL